MSNKVNEEDNILEIKNLYMKYKKSDKHFTLNDLNFNVKKGDFHAFIGENGAGKSSTIKIISGLNNDFEGDVLINGLNTRENFNSRNGFFYIPDKNFFPSYQSVFDYLYNVAVLTRNDKEKIKIEINDLAKKFDIEEIIERNPNKLSSGQAKKVLLIQAILTKVNFLILDEPTTFLDSTTRIILLNELKRMNQENNTTIFISTHILDEIKNYINSVTFIKKGNVKWSGKIKGEDLIKRYHEVILGEQND
ncbi:MAG: ABC transporter ATP-binding protein [Mycoplasma sp.]|nr:ABC transporter ATP-binding protein [Mycoplasma sp.]